MVAPLHCATACGARKGLLYSSFRGAEAPLFHQTQPRAAVPHGYGCARGPPAHLDPTAPSESGLLSSATQRKGLLYHHFFAALKRRSSTKHSRGGGCATRVWLRTGPSSPPRSHRAKRGRPPGSASQRKGEFAPIFHGLKLKGRSSFSAAHPGAQAQGFHRFCLTIRRTNGKVLHWPPGGSVSWRMVFENTKLLAPSCWLLARKPQKHWVMLGDVGSTWVDIGGRGRGALRPSADLGLGLGAPWATLGPRKGHPSVAHGPAKRGIAEVPLFATKVEKWRAGVRRNRRNRRHRTRSGKQKPTTDKRG
jgi:hypothetical protein